MPRFTGTEKSRRGRGRLGLSVRRIFVLNFVPLRVGLLVALCGTPPAVQAQLNRSSGQDTLRRAGSVVTTTALGANGVFTGAWNDANIDGTTFVQAGVRADQASAANGFEIDESDDTSDGNFTRVVVSATVGANTTTWVSATIRGRNWRVKYTNGGTAQTSFQLTAQTGVSYGNGEGTVGTTAAGNALCLNSSAAVAVQALVTYTQF